MFIEVDYSFMNFFSLLSKDHSKKSFKKRMYLHEMHRSIASIFSKDKLCQ
ncbi:uncharacterized protein J3R85_002007 [Psidium guajava]|nr:uncharacterized protein J3R85_002007 [Psidium guajava]